MNTQGRGVNTQARESVIEGFLKHPNVQKSILNVLAVTPESQLGILFGDNFDRDEVQKFAQGLSVEDNEIDKIHRAALAILTYQAFTGNHAMKDLIGGNNTVANTVSEFTKIPVADIQLLSHHVQKAVGQFQTAGALAGDAAEARSLVGAGGSKFR